MQIHELTRRKTNEGLIGSLAAGVGTQLAKQGISKALGGADVLNKGGPVQSREQGFQSQVNSPAAATLATTLQKAWQQTLHNFLMNSKDASGNPATSIKAVTQPSVGSLEQELETLVNNSIGGRGASFSYRNMANNVSDPVAKQGVQEVIARISEYIKQIYTATISDADPKQTSGLWVKLVGDGILPGQNAMAYDKKSFNSNKARLYKDPTGKNVIDLGSGPEWFDLNNPAHKAYWDKLNSGTA